GRQVAAANGRIGGARTAWLPDVTLDLWGGVQSGSFSGLFDAPARVWSLGPSLAEALLDGGQRSAALELAVARHEEQAAFYRQTVIDSLRELEDGLATLQVLGEKAEQQAAFLQLAEENGPVAVGIGGVRVLDGRWGGRAVFVVRGRAEGRAVHAVRSGALLLQAGVAVVAGGRERWSWLALGRAVHAVGSGGAAPTGWGRRVERGGDYCGSPGPRGEWRAPARPGVRITPDRCCPWRWY